MDGDGQHDPSFVPSLIAAIQKEETDIAIGSRFLKEAKGTLSVDLPCAVDS